MEDQSEQNPELVAFIANFFTEVLKARRDIEELAAFAKLRERVNGEPDSEVLAASKQALQESISNLALCMFLIKHMTQKQDEFLAVETSPQVN